MDPICKVCNKHRKTYFFRDKLVCFRCDDLVFDIEMECLEAIPKVESTRHRVLKIGDYAHLTKLRSKLKGE